MVIYLEETLATSRYIRGCRTNVKNTNTKHSNYNYVIPFAIFGIAEIINNKVELW